MAHSESFHAIMAVVCALADNHFPMCMVDPAKPANSFTLRYATSWGDTEFPVVMPVSMFIVSECESTGKCVVNIHTKMLYDNPVKESDYIAVDVLNSVTLNPVDHITLLRFGMMVDVIINMMGYSIEQVERMRSAS